MIAAYVGYKLAGFAGAIVSAVCIFAPAFFLVLPLMPLLEPLMPLLDPVVPFAASGYFFIKARHCESFCIALGDMPWHFVQVAFSLLVMLDDDAANPAPANAAVMQTPRAKVASVFIGVSSFFG
jgi:hypothetical protein